MIILDSLRPSLWCISHMICICELVNSLAPVRPRCHFKTATFNLVLLIGIFTSSNDNALRWMPRGLTDGKSTLVQLMAWCRQALGPNELTVVQVMTSSCHSGAKPLPEHTQTYTSHSAWQYQAITWTNIKLSSVQAIEGTEPRAPDTWFWHMAPLLSKSRGPTWPLRFTWGL